MGYLVEYKCPKCNFKRELHEGIGRASFAKNYICKDCWDLTSMLIEQDDKNVIKKGINRQSRFTLIDDNPKQFHCEHCNSNNLEEWTAHHCPQCSHKMNKQDEYLWGLWH